MEIVWYGTSKPHITYYLAEFLWRRKLGSRTNASITLWRWFDGDIQLLAEGSPQIIHLVSSICLCFLSKNVQVRSIQLCMPLNLSFAECSVAVPTKFTPLSCSKICLSVPLCLQLLTSNDLRFQYCVIFANSALPSNICNGEHSSSEVQ